MNICLWLMIFRTKMTRLTAGLVLALSGINVSAVDVVKLTTESYPPFNMMTKSGHVSGISTDIIRELFRRSQIPVQIELLPWNRAYTMAQETPNIGVYSTTRTQERESLFKWVSPLTLNNWVFLARSDSNIQLSSLDDARKYRIGAYRGGATARYLESKGFDLDVVNRNDLNALKLARGRIDLWATGHLLGPYLARKHGVDGLVNVLTYKETTMGVAFHPETSDTLIEHLNNTLQSMYDDGTVNKIYDEYR